MSKFPYSLYGGNLVTMTASSTTTTAFRELPPQSFLTDTVIPLFSNALDKGASYGPCMGDIVTCDFSRCANPTPM